MINPECLYFNDDVAQFRFRLRHLLDDYTVQTTKVIYNDGSHINSSMGFYLGWLSYAKN